MGDPPPPPLPDAMAEYAHKIAIAMGWSTFEVQAALRQARIWGDAFDEAMQDTQNALDDLIARLEAFAAKEACFLTWEPEPRFLTWEPAPPCIPLAAAFGQQQSRPRVNVLASCDAARAPPRDRGSGHLHRRPASGRRASFSLQNLQTKLLISGAQ